jgi:translation initiation factor 1
MGNKNKNKAGGLVYSTDPNFSYHDEAEMETESLAPEKQKIRVLLERKGRGGKEVTLLEGFVGTDAEKEELIKILKSHIGTGGGYKEGELILQGDHRDKTVKFLIAKGYTNTKRGN